MLRLSLKNARNLVNHMFESAHAGAVTPDGPFWALLGRAERAEKYLRKRRLRGLL